ncbi:biosynthetic-type acetolactate synthase large subunit [Bullifex porci]|uniref:Acetolactate synthase n=1 Tax=Bullifex porci TaxID=2606638 RepID=A0A7X2TPP0_9SPIO|nr:biosynthetic-type acetolactate synthase large subunit [Bullifex porci]MDD7588875.1 biosynthetic-type acetolactate synthase large subunit [Bullifex porci]MSU05629.1 biosynthetic-type acetolactate synthase large subunit [Bullifex porci]
MQITGAQLIIECLIEQGVDRVFGYPGGQVIPLYDALYMNRDRIKHILTAHEQGASHAADGYARSSGKVGVCIATSGPGATNLVTGLATAYMDSSPVVAITGNVPVTLLGRDSFQEVDITGVTMPITKHNYIVKDKNELAATLREAFKIAKEGRPGPVLVDIPKNIQQDLIEYERVEIEPVKRSTSRLRDDDIEKAINLISLSERPMCYIGGGVIRSDASAELVEFIDRIDAPVCSSLMALGAVPSFNPRFTGMVGMHGTKVSNLMVNSCDLLIVIGARFSDRVISKGSTFATQARILQLDIDPAEFDKNIISDSHVVGDIKEILTILNSRLEKREHKDWMDRVQDAKRRFPMKVTLESKRPREILKALDDVLSTEKDAFVATEVGQHQMWAAQYLKHNKPRHFLTSGGLGTMGFGTGAAIGAQIANPEARVVNVAGDGSFRMNCNELATIARYKLPVVILVFNNHCLGMVRQWQNLFFQKHYSETTLDTPLDWVMLANAYGVKGMRLKADDDAEAILKSAFELNEGVVVDCEIPIDDKVLPMVAPGASINDMMGFIDNEGN